MERNVQLKNEFFLADAVNILIEHGALMRVEKVETWLDTGTIEATLDTNRHLLERAKFKSRERAGVKINEPVFVHESAEIKDSEIGPYASIAANCKITGSKVEDSIIESDCEIRDVGLKNSFIGRQARVEGRGADETFTLNIGDTSSVKLF
jgi:glucose-1-phosphate thymidylyltransferase